MQAPAITRFRGDYEFLSNFAPVQVLFRGEPYPTAEHAFQAAKALYDADRLMIQAAATPRGAKQLGRKVQIREDWDLVKKRVMLEVVLAKFTPFTYAAMLVKTWDLTLIEGNDWGDTFWGAIPAAAFTARPGSEPPPLWQPEGGEKLAGFNWLGRCLMMARAVLER